MASRNYSKSKVLKSFSPMSYVAIYIKRIIFDGRPIFDE